MSACAWASSVASLPCALSILNSDELYPAIWKAFVKYGRSELTHRVDDVVSGMSTPTRPLPAACKSFSVAMAEKLTSNEEMLRPEGTVAVGPVAAVLLPQAPTTTTKTPAVAVSVRLLSLRNFIWTSCPPRVVSCAFFPERPGARVRRHQVYSDVHGGVNRPLCAESIAQPLEFVKRVIPVACQFVCALDKPRRHAMIRWRCRK